MPFSLLCDHSSAVGSMMMMMMLMLLLAAGSSTLLNHSLFINLTRPSTGDVCLNAEDQLIYVIFACTH